MVRLDVTMCHIIQWRRTYFAVRCEYEFARVQLSTLIMAQLFIPELPSGATQGDLSSDTSTSESPDAYPQDGVSGNYWYSDRTAITVSPPSSISVSPQPAQGGQQCIRELGSGLFRRRGHLQLRAEQAAGRRQLDGGGHLWRQHPHRLGPGGQGDGDHRLPGAGQGRARLLVRLHRPAAPTR